MTTKPTAIEKILAEVRVERDRQTAVGSNLSDPRRRPNEWIAFITAYLGRAACACYRNDREGYGWPRFREMMLKVAALAVEAVEWHDQRVINR